MNDYDIPFYGFSDSVKILNTADIKKCPMLILWPPHYREDGSCRCDETICEENDCTNNKWNGEIFCETHVDGSW